MKGWFFWPYIYDDFIWINFNAMQNMCNAFCSRLFRSFFAYVNCIFGFLFGFWFAVWLSAVESRSTKLHSPSTKGSLRRKADSLSILTTTNIFDISTSVPPKCNISIQNWQMTSEDVTRLRFRFRFRRRKNDSAEN